MKGEFLGLLRPGVEVYAADPASAKENLSIADTCVKAQSPFDRCARVGLPQLDKTVDVNQSVYLAFLTTQVMGWAPGDVAALRRIIPSLRPAFEPLDYVLPEKVWLIKTTGREEAAAAYTKHKDTIVLPSNMVASVQVQDNGGDPLHPGFTDHFLAGVITHEFFHLLSKNNPGKRQDWYKVVQYEELRNEIELPTEPGWWQNGSTSLSMADLKITNPDAPLINVAIRLPIAAGAEETLLAPALLSSEPYSGGAFFDTLEWLFLEVLQEDDRDVLRTYDNGEPAVHKADDLLPAYREKVGYYLSGELFHPDELLAQSFALAAKEFRPPLLESIAKAIWPKWPV